MLLLARSYLKFSLKNKLYKKILRCQFVSDNFSFQAKYITVTCLESTTNFKKWKRFKN